MSVADPAFSFDGQTLAYSRYDTVTGAPLGPGFVDVHGAHATRTLTANVGKLWAYQGTDRGLGARTQIGSGWSTYTAVVPVGDLTSDDRAGQLVRYPMLGDGSFMHGQFPLGYGWNGLLITS